MATELESKLTGILNWVEETAKAAESFAIEQTPLYIQELLAWNFWYSLIWFIIDLVLFIIALNCVRIVVKAGPGYFEDDNANKWVPTVFGGLFCLIIGLMGISLSDFDWLQISVAPRVWLVEYVASKLN